MGFSGMLWNPAKSCFLQLAAASIREVNLKRDENGLTYAREAMTRTGMAMNLNNHWDEQQPFLYLQEIIRKIHSHFNEEKVNPLYIMNSYTVVLSLKHRQL